jgi:hypothetical protein
VGHYRIRTNGIPSASLIQVTEVEPPGTMPAMMRFAGSAGPFAGDMIDVYVSDPDGAFAEAWYFSLVLLQTQ